MSRELFAMNINKQLAAWGEIALSNIDDIGFKLDEIGVENQINRHTLIAMLMAGQRRFEGEMDSLSARLDSGKSKINGVTKSAENVLMSGVNLVTFPAKYAATRVKEAIA